MASLSWIVIAVRLIVTRSIAARRFAALALPLSLSLSFWLTGALLPSASMTRFSTSGC